MSWEFHHFQKWGGRLRGKDCRFVTKRRLLDIPNRLVSCVDKGMVWLDAVAGRQAFLQQRRKLL